MSRRRTIFRLFVHVVAACCGLFIGGFVGFLAWWHFFDQGLVVKGMLLSMLALAAGLESWRQTLRLNLPHDEPNR